MMEITFMPSLQLALAVHHCLMLELNDGSDARDAAICVDAATIGRSSALRYSDYDGNTFVWVLQNRTSDSIQLIFATREQARDPRYRVPYPTEASRDFIFPHNQPYQAAAAIFTFFNTGVYPEKSEGVYSA